MLNDFISVIDNCISKDDCQQYIDWIEHYISNGLVFKERVNYHSKDHFTINSNNEDPSRNSNDDYKNQKRNSFDSEYEQMMQARSEVYGQPQRQNINFSR